MAKKTKAQKAARDRARYEAARQAQDIADNDRKKALGTDNNSIAEAREAANRRHKDIQSEVTVTKSGNTRTERVTVNTPRSPRRAPEGRWRCGLGRLHDLGKRCGCKPRPRM